MATKKYNYDWIAHFARERGLKPNNSGRFPVWEYYIEGDHAYDPKLFINYIVGELPLDKYSEDDREEIAKRISDIYVNHELQYPILQKALFIQSRKGFLDVWVPIAAVTDEDFQAEHNDFSEVWIRIDDLWKDIERVLDRFEPEDRTTRRAKVLETEQKFEHAKERSIWDWLPSETVMIDEFLGEELAQFAIVEIPKQDITPVVNAMKEFMKKYPLWEEMLTVQTKAGIENGNSPLSADSLSSEDIELNTAAYYAIFPVYYDGEEVKGIRKALENLLSDDPTTRRFRDFTGNPSRIGRAESNPAWIRTRKDEQIWERAKKQIEKEYGKPIRWPIVTHVYKKMGGKV